MRILMCGDKVVGRTDGTGVTRLLRCREGVTAVKTRQVIVGFLRDTHIFEPPTKNARVWPVEIYVNRQ